MLVFKLPLSLCSDVKLRASSPFNVALDTPGEYDQSGGLQDANGISDTISHYAL